MKAHQANLFNSITLIVIGAWGAAATSLNSMTALIPVVGGILLLLCQNGVKNENKTIAHIAVVLTLILVVGLVKPFSSALSDGDNLGALRTGVMILTGLLALGAFIKSFIDARKVQS